MKLYYADIRYQLPAFLADLAAGYAKEGKRVFYIAPNSLSFEKERAVLSRLENGASFDILVTRFAQMARYFSRFEEKERVSVDDIGLSMLFFRVLSQLSDTDLRVYGKLKQDSQFIQQLVDLYKDFQRANVRFSDLDFLDDEDKKADLQLIFAGLEELLSAENYESESKIAQFRRTVESDCLNAELADVVVIVDGFTRFSAEELALVTALEGRVAELVVGCYASKKAYQMTYIEGNLYQAGVEFIRELAQTFATKPHYLVAEKNLDSLGKISQNLESYYDFSATSKALTEEDKTAIELWEVSNQKVEVEQVARTIRQLLYQGVRYKDILVLLGDVDSYSLQIGKIFDKYAIPYYLGKAEEMSHHPLVHFVESLERLVRYNFRAEDLLNLLKSGLYGRISQKEIDAFEQYVLFADVKGKSQFSKEFAATNGKRYDLEQLNQTRIAIMDPLLTLFKAKAQSGRSLLQKFTRFLAAISLMENMAQLSEGFGELEQEKDEQVWKSFTHILEEMHQIFGDERLKLDDFLALLRSGMLASHYRVVPATVDVVNVKSYDLIEPHTAKYIYAIGLTQSNFPKSVKNSSLLTEEERLCINEANGQVSRFDIASKEYTKKNHFAMISLVNAASQKLVLSRPQLFNEAEDAVSPYLKLLHNMGIPVEEKGRFRGLEQDDLVHYKSLLARVIEVNRLQFEQEWTKEEETFWSVAVRYLRKKLEQEQIVIPAITGEVTTTPLAQETLDVLYPLDKPLHLSASSLTDFYRNEYLYFIKYILKLREKDSIRPDARSHGNFLHQIFEKVTTDYTSASFDEKLSRAIASTRKNGEFKALYQHSAESRYSEDVLLDIARATSLVLREDKVIRTLGVEAQFGEQGEVSYPLESGHRLQIIGKIDRLDQLVTGEALGIVDYKSSATHFKIDRFYNGLSPQLMTYIAAVRTLPDVSETEKVFGAMYLHMLDPIVKLTDTKEQDKVLEEAYKLLVYKGLFLEEESQQLNQLYNKTKASLFTDEELQLMLAYNQHLYQQAGSKIVSGQFAVNPYTEDGRSVAGEQLKSITGFEADRHLAQARHLIKGGKREEWLERMKKGVEDEF